MSQKSFANFAASSFLSSKRSLKKFYGLTVYETAVLRYICDSIDLAYSKSKKLQTRIYQSQVAKYCHIERKRANKAIHHLIAKKLLISLGAKRAFKDHRCVPDGYTSTLSIGLVLKCTLQGHGIDVSLTDSRPRCVLVGYTSNVSNITKGKSKSTSSRHKDQKPKIKSIKSEQNSQQESDEELRERIKQEWSLG